jgi:nitrogen fixation/metabolism regulation signal transduction histidine kinase
VAALKGMVDAFSQYARSPVADLQPIDLNQLVGEVLGLYESSRPAMRLDLAQDLPPVWGDTAKLRQVIHNLLQNAEQAVADSSAPRIRVRTVLAESTARLGVMDNGPGFPQEILQRAFEPYVTTRPKGTGLGLAIVKKIVEEHNGSIEIANVAPGGAEVIIVLPIAERAAVGDRPRTGARVG